MTRYYYFAFSDCKDPAREDEYNDWYSNTHIPDMIEVPGMIRATRWEAAEEKENGIRKFLSLYEFETDDLDEFNRQVAIYGKRTMDEGRWSDLAVLDPDNVPRIYRQIMPAKYPKGKEPKE
ncbi:MAG: hypothetical protein GX631_07630 [Dehalococcoidales bacterium]|nr:hypothetical protein [Dehalococcoidales bacterium]